MNLRFPNFVEMCVMQRARSTNPREGAGEDHGPVVTTPPASAPPITSHFSASPGWMLAVLRRDGKGRTLFTYALVSSEPLQGEQIWSYGPGSLWEWTSAPAEWAQCGAGSNTHTHTHNLAAIINCRLVQTSVLRRPSLPPGFCSEGLREVKFFSDRFLKLCVINRRSWKSLVRDRNDIHEESVTDSRLT